MTIWLHSSKKIHAWTSSASRDVQRIEKVVRERARHVRDVYWGMRRSPLSGEKEPSGTVLLVGQGGVDPSLPFLAHAQRLEGPVPLARVLSGTVPTRGRIAEIVLSTDSLNAEPESAVDQVLRVLDQARSRVLITAPTTAAQERLTTLRVAMDRRRSGRVAGITHLGPDGRNPDRLVVVKRHIGHLVLIAGPSAAGKSSLMQQLVAPGRPEAAERSGRAKAAALLAEHLNITPGRHWVPVAYAKHLHEISTPNLDRLLLQYDFSRPARRHWAHDRPDPVLDVVESASRASAVTVWTPPHRLRQQAQQRDRKWTRLRRGSAKTPKANRYNDSEAILRMYQNFFHAVRGRVDEHCVIEIDTQVRFHDPAQWPELPASATG